MRVLHSSLVGERPIHIALMIDGSTDLLAQSRNNSPGGSLTGLGVEGMDGAEAVTVVFHVQRDTSLINDNYCVSPPVVNQVIVWRDSQHSKTDCTTSSSEQFKLSQSSQVCKNSQLSKTFKADCILSCCKSCSYCKFRRASAKERYKARSEKDRNKACQRCFFCKSMSFCHVCSQCPHCCQRAGCRGKTSELLAQMARTRCKSKGGFHFEGRLCPTFQNEVSSHQKWSRKPGKKPVSDRGLKCLEREVGSRKGGCPDIPVLVQLVVPGPKAQQQVETHFGPQLNVYLQTGTMIRVSAKGEWVTSLDFGDAYFHIHIQPRSRKYGSFLTARHISSQPSLSGWPQPCWNLPRWSKK